MMRNWLDGFAYHTMMPWSVFIGAALLACAIAFMTVCSQSLKVVLSNPVKALRHE